MKSKADIISTRIIQKSPINLQLNLKDENTSVGTKVSISLKNISNRATCTQKLLQQ